MGVSFLEASQQRGRLEGSTREPSSAPRYRTWPPLHLASLPAPGLRVLPAEPQLLTPLAAERALPRGTAPAKSTAAPGSKEEEGAQVS